MPITLFPPGIPWSKRLIDLVLTGIGLVLISPLLGILALMVRIAHGSPILFRQTRPGYQGQLFNILKFRTMTDARDSRGHLRPDEERVTRFGRFMRAASLDELPELFNILRGEMSLVGPRPLLEEYLARYTPEQARRHEVVPGMTGWAQINGRNVLSWEEKFQLDVWYVDHWSLGLDIKILLTTLWKALKREGISQEGHVSAEVFMGTAKNEVRRENLLETEIERAEKPDPEEGGELE